MNQDPANRYLTTILSQCDIRDKELLEVGCGKGRITRDLLQYARRVVATDPDLAALATARSALSGPKAEFRLEPSGIPDLPPESFDLVLYTLSLHHVPEAEMLHSLNCAARLLRPGGKIVVIEPGDGGSLTEAKERFGAGGGDERAARAAAIRAMHALAGWQVGETLPFRIEVHYLDEDDFFRNMFPGRELPQPLREEILGFLERHRSGGRIVLDAGRLCSVLSRES